MYLAVRTASDPDSIIPAVRAQVRAVDKDQPIEDLRTMDQLLADSIAPRRFHMLLLGVFAALGLALAAIGIYGVVSYSVVERTQEIGIRIALGARAPDVLRQALRQGIPPAMIGLAAGLVGAAALTRLLVSLLYGVTPTDPLTFAAVSALLAGVALLAAYLPARRATRVDPVQALRYE